MGRLVKPTIDKSYVMKCAWNTYRMYKKFGWTFSDALKQAWFEGKRILTLKMDTYLSDLEQRRKEDANVKIGDTCAIVIPTRTFEDGVADYYCNASRGTYFGD